jgi:dGTPase
MRMANKARFFIEKLFNLYLSQPMLLPSLYRDKAHDQACRRQVICDYIAGMTDRYALDEYKKLFEPYERV